MEDEEVLCRFGTPLEPLEEDEIPSKKPIQIEDQIVTDKNGRRRFHGAFTGGFSAGFWNTVGSLEGWQPKEFKSSRAEKAEHLKQKLSDFMDDEDVGAFGIAPQRVQTTDDFTPQDKIGQKRKVQPKIDGPIPGVPVLQQLLRPAKEMVAIRLLKKMGWKQGQGIGARQTRKNKKITAKRNAREQYIMKMYGCKIGPNNSLSKDLDSDSDLSDSEEITFAPDDFEPYVCIIKDNTFGLGYTGLCRDPILKNQHVNLFGPLEIVDKDNKKLSIRGQAFGVGALEEEDEDIYQRDDMTRYDFTLGNATKLRNTNKPATNQESFVIDGFSISKSSKKNKKIFKVPVPDNFTPRNWLKRKTRFEPLDNNLAETLKQIDEYKRKGLGRHDLNPTERGRILENTTVSLKPAEKHENDKKDEVKHKKSYIEKINEKYKDREMNSKKRNDVLDMLSSKFDKFTNSEVIKEDGSVEKHTNLIEEDVICDSVKQENEQVQSEANKITSKLDKYAGVFKPFLSDDIKQERYDKFVAQNLNSDDDINKFLLTIQPLHMSEWDKEIEKKEFLQAQKIYRPLKGLMKDRFVPECAIMAEREIKKVAKDCNEKLITSRIKQMWKPCSELCKRFNIAEPFGGTMIEEKIVKKTKYSVFDYLETSINDKRNFITPVIIPTKAEIAKPIIQQQRLSTKELFTNELKTCKKTEESLNKHKDDVNSDNINSHRELNKKQKEAIVEKPKVEKPKTNLEKRIEETKDQHPSEKKNLFKSIFDSSSEDEDDEENKKKVDTSKSNEIPNEIISILTKPTNELNNLPSKTSTESNTKLIHENINITTTSKAEIPQPIQKIIFKSKKQRLADENAQYKETELSTEITSSKDSAEPINVNTVDRLESENIIEDDYIYGPKIPTDMAKINLSVDIKSDEKLLNVLKKHKKTKIVEEWVEKTEENSNMLALITSKKKKKKDKEKEKHKKSKKHKKDKKK